MLMLSYKPDENIFLGLVSLSRLLQNFKAKRPRV